LDAARQRPVYFMHGNRDFLVGRACLDACGVTLLGDPTVLQFAGQRWLLSHGADLQVIDILQA
jgi:UDP-2,3-diacylglucosamine hydrolase